MKNIHIQDFKVTSSIKLKNISTSYDLEASEKDIEKALKKVRKDLAKIQDTMYAHDKYSVLVCLQGMDTAGKDSLVKEVFKSFNSRGIIVHSFKVPTEKELGHDYLWRHYIALPEKGKFGVFNRTHYENVLVTRVHPYYILNEHIPGIHTVDDIDEAFWDKRFEQINNFEKHLSESGTIIFKFFLHLSKDEQKSRLLSRLEKQEKNWKFSKSDIKERQLWDNYQECYEAVLNKSSTSYAPWYAIPADNKETGRYLVARVLYDTLKAYTDIKEPELSDDVKVNLELYKQQLKNE